MTSPAPGTTLVDAFRRSPVRWVGAALIVIAVGLYAGTLGHGFVWDDSTVINSQLPAFRSLARVFFPPAGVADLSPRYYRPVVWLSYLLDDALAGSSPDAALRARSQAFVFHGAAVLLHGAATLLVFLLGLSLARSFGSTGRSGLWPAAAAGVLFATHPIHVDSVASIVGRSDSLCAVFLLSALLLYLRHLRQGEALTLAAAGAAALAAMLSKEIGVAALALAPLIDLVHRPRPAANRTAIRWGAFAAAGALYGLLRLLALSRLAAGPPVSAPWRPSALLRAVGWCVAKSIWPSAQTPFTPTIPASFAVVGVVAMLALGLAALLFARRPDWGRELIAVGLFGATLAPALAVPALGVTYLPVAERYLYLPTAGVCLLVGFLLQRGASFALRRFAPAAAAVAPLAAAIVVAMPAGAAAVSHARIWRDDLTLWTHAVSRTPRHGIPRVQRGAALEAAGRFDEAAAEYARAADLFVDRLDRARALSNLGGALQRLGRLDHAVEALRRARDQAPAHWPAHFNLAMVQFALAARSTDESARRRHTAAAVADLQHVLELEPTSVPAHLQLGLALLRGGDLELGAQHLREVLRLAPTSAEAGPARQALSRLPPPPAR